MGFSLGKLLIGEFGQGNSEARYDNPVVSHDDFLKHRSKDKGMPVLSLVITDYSGKSAEEVLEQSNGYIFLPFSQQQIIDRCRPEFFKVLEKQKGLKIYPTVTQQIYDHRRHDSPEYKRQFSNMWRSSLSSIMMTNIMSVEDFWQDPIFVGNLEEVVHLSISARPDDESTDRFIARLNEIPPEQQTMYDYLTAVTIALSPEGEDFPDRMPNPPTLRRRTIRINEMDKAELDNIMREWKSMVGHLWDKETHPMTNYRPIIIE